MMESAFRTRNNRSGNDNVDSDVQRPPVYNAEDYTEYLRKYCKFTGLQLYLNTGTDIHIKSAKTKILGKRPEKSDSFGLFDKHQIEMGLKQFTSISELLNKLKIDLHLSYHSFLKEFISEPNDGVTLLLDLLKVVQLSQTNIAGVHNSIDSKIHQSVFKKALADEHECLLCLKLCGESEDGGLRLVDHPSGLFTVSVCVMSNFSKSRVLALQLLTKMCTINHGHKQVSDAVSMLRLRFGEPVRFKFLIGMLNSFNSGAFQISCLRFLNTFVETASNYRERVHIQAELEDAGFDISHLKKLVSKFGNQSDLLKEELNIWMKNYIDVNALVTEKLLIQRTLDKAKTDLESLRKKYQDLELKHKKMVNEYTQAIAKCDSYEDQLNQTRWVEGGNSETNSDHDSGKHSDNSLVISSEECWAEIDKINKNYNLLKSSADLSNMLQPQKIKDNDWSKSCDSNRSKFPLGHTHQNNQRNVHKNTEQRTHGAPSIPLTPTTESDSDKSSYSEKQEKETLGEEGTNKDVNIVIISSESTSSFKEDNDHDTYVERDTLQEETVMVESQTIAVNQTFHNYVRPSGNNKPQTVVRSSSSAKSMQYVTHSPPGATKTESNGIKSDKSHAQYISHNYDDVPLPPSPKQISKYRNREKPARKDNEVTIVSPLTDEEGPTDIIKRQPRPPVRRRPRSKINSERPKSAPPEKYNSVQFSNERKRNGVVHLKDLSDGETSDANISTLSRDASNQDGNGDSNQGTLETVSAKSFGFIRPSQRLLEREQNKRIKRHKSFFNADSLFGKKNSLIRRAESFHHGGSKTDYHLMNAKNTSKDARERAKSVDRLLSAGDETVDDIDKPMKKSKSMEFLKSKILRKPSKAQRKSPRPEASRPILGQSMFELHKTPNYSTNTHSNTHMYPDWPFANSSLFPSSEFSKQDVKPSLNSSKLCETTQRLPTYGHSGQNYDWRQDTPFWNYSRQGRKENVIGWGLPEDEPPKWVPPPPQQYVNNNNAYAKPKRKSKESMSHPPIGLPGCYPGLPLNQAVNSMYLPTPNIPPYYQEYVHSSPSPNMDMEDSMLEITELEDEPLVSTPSREYFPHHTRSPDNIIQHPVRILEMPSGLY